MQPTWSHRSWREWHDQLASCWPASTVIVYSSIMIENRPESLRSSRSTRGPKFVVAQVLTGMFGRLTGTLNRESVGRGFEPRPPHNVIAGKRGFPLHSINPPSRSRCHQLSSLKGRGVVKGVLSCFDLGVGSAEPIPVSRWSARSVARTNDLDDGAQRFSACSVGVEARRASACYVVVVQRLHG